MARRRPSRKASTRTKPQPSRRSSRKRARRSRSSEGSEPQALLGSCWHEALTGAVFGRTSRTKGHYLRTSRLGTVTIGRVPQGPPVGVCWKALGKLPGAASIFLLYEFPQHARTVQPGLRCAKSRPVFGRAK